MRFIIKDERSRTKDFLVKKIIVLIEVRIRVEASCKFFFENFLRSENRKDSLGDELE
jgi:hypothetical protein